MCWSSAPGEDAPPPARAVLTGVPSPDGRSHHGWALPAGEAAKGTPIHGSGSLALKPDLSSEAPRDWRKKGQPHPRLNSEVLLVGKPQDDAGAVGDNDHSQSAWPTAVTKRMCPLTDKGNGVQGPAGRNMKERTSNGNNQDR